MGQFKNILLCSPKGIVGGISKWTTNILSYSKLNKDNVSIDWYYTKESLLQQVKSNGFISRIYWGIRTYIPFLFGLNKLITKNKYDIVHFSTSASISLIRDIIAIRLCKKRNIKTIIHCHFGRIPQIYQTNGWERKLLHRVLLLVDVAIIMDKASFDILQDHNYKNIKLVPNPLAEETCQLIKKIDVEERVQRTILFAGHVIKTKGIYELIESCKQIPNINLKILGSYTNEMYNSLYEVVGGKGIEWLHIEGNKKFEDVIMEMKKCSVFVLPTYTEGFPNVIIESMACGCPIVTTPVGAIPEMLDIEHGETCGICVPPQNVEKLRDAIEKMLNDREYALRCGKNAQERVNKCYSMPIVWNQLVDIWNETITR